MAAVTNMPFRILCKKYGCGLTFTEQINATHIARAPEIASGKTFYQIRTCAAENPVGIQLFGIEEKDFIKAIELVEKKFDLININCGCPSHCLTDIGAGGALLKKLKKMQSILSAVKSVSTKPVTAKIRLGWSKNDSRKIIKSLEKANVDGVIVHGRTVSQMFSGKADYKAIKKIVDSCSIPVVANGDICDGKSAKQILEKTNAKFAMIGRGAMGNPFIFREIETFMKKGYVQKPLPKEKVSAFFEYVELCKKFNQLDVNDLKLQAIYFTKGIDSVKRIRIELLKSKKAEETIGIMKRFSKGFLC